jgi:hypothetical protein
MGESGGGSVDESRLSRLERDTRDLRARVERLERAMAQLLEHPVDRAAVREKVRYDWQG